MTKGSYKNTKKNKKGKGNESKPNQTTSVKQEMKFTPVGKYRNFTPFNTVKDDFVVESQSMPCKAKVQIIEATRNETELDWDAMKPEKEIASYDPDTRSFRKETMTEFILRQQVEDQQGSGGVTTRSQGQGQEESKTGDPQATQQATTDVSVQRMVDMLQKTYDDDCQMRTEA